MSIDTDEMSLLTPFSRQICEKVAHNPSLLAQ